MNHKRNLVFWDHSYHSFTRSSEFFCDILKEDYEVFYFEDNSWRGGARPKLHEVMNIEPSVIIFWQTIPPPEIIRKVKATKIFVPMRDDEHTLSTYFWKPYAFCDLRVVCFSREIYKKVRQLGLEAKYLHFYPEPDHLSFDNRTGDKLNIFFWQRTAAITWETIKILLGNTLVDKIYFRLFPDPGYEMTAGGSKTKKEIKLPSKEDIQKYNIHFFEDWLTKENYLKILDDCHIFIAPRPLEGIGISFLEAMAKGLCVIAPDLPVANEYIINKHNGMLYDLEKPSPLDFKNIQKFCRQALFTTINGRIAWEQEKIDTLEFIKKVPSQKRNFTYMKRPWIDIQNFLKVICARYRS